MKRRGFTIPELLIIIAIIAMLISLLLPGLAKSRTQSRLTVSTSNLRVLCLASNMYQFDNRGAVPITMTYNHSGRSRTRPPDQARPNFGATGFCGWSFAGTNPNGHWYLASRGWFDVLAVDRPLNQYVYQEVRFEDPSTPDNPNARLPADSPSRSNTRLKVFQDPSDVIGHQETWPGNNPSGRTNFESVGISYIWQAKWYELADSSGSVNPATFNSAVKSLQLSDTFKPSRFVWVWDEFADTGIYSFNPNYARKNNYGDLNRSVMGFMDGHVGYHTFRPGRNRDSYINQDYDLCFSLNGSASN